VVYIIDRYMLRGYARVMKDTMLRTALFVRSSQMTKLQTLSKVTGAPVAELVRRAIDAYLEQRKAEIKNA
jgi:predicted DNA-binding protein